VEGEQKAPDAASNNSHLRSIWEVKGYHIEARDGSIGHVGNFIIRSLDTSQP